MKRYVKASQDSRFTHSYIIELLGYDPYTVDHDKEIDAYRESDIDVYSDLCIEEVADEVGSISKDQFIDAVFEKLVDYDNADMYAAGGGVSTEGIILGVIEHESEILNKIKEAYLEYQF